MQKTKVEIKGVVFLINTVKGDIANEDRGQIVVVVVRKGVEVFGLLPKTFREAGVDQWRQSSVRSLS